MRWSIVPVKKDKNGELLNHPDNPFHRYGHTVVTYNDKIYLWGGRNDVCSCNILYCFDVETHTWSRPEVTGDIPGPRDGHSACVYKDKMYIFGGFQDDIDQFSCDVHSLDFKTMTWSYIPTIGTPPSYRDFHSAAAINDRMYIFGGRGDKHSPYHSMEEIYCSDIVYLDLNTNTWCMPRTTGNVPVGRRSHSMFIYQDLIYVFGGYNGILEEHFNDLHTFDPKTNRWRVVKPDGAEPSTRRRQVCLVIGNKMFMFGGTSPNKNALSEEFPKLIDNNDTHVLDFEPTLKTLAIMAVLENRIDYSSLPYHIRYDIQVMTTPNMISRSANHAG